MLTLIVKKENFDLDKNKIRILEKKDINHLKNVYRSKTGDLIRVVDGENEYITEILEVENKEVTLGIREKSGDRYSLKADIDIALGILKNDKMNLAIQKLTEIGINKIIPLKTERVVVKLDDSKEKWGIVIEEALKQCRGVKIPELCKITKIRDINFKSYDKVFFAYENCDESRNIFQLLDGAEKSILYIIGPEGGFTEKEADFMRSGNAVEISLGNRIYRAETAAIAIGGILANVFK